MKRRKLERWLKEHGARFARHGSRHDVWQNEDGEEATIPRHKEINTHTARHICEQLGAPEPRER